MISDAGLAAFQKHLHRYGCSRDTALKYAREVRLCSLEDDLRDRLVSDELSPSYLRLIRASLMAWAKYKENKTLESELARIKLPPAGRLKEKTALPKKKLQKLIQVIDEAEFLSDPVRADLGILACRGLRSSDVLRMERAQVVQALRGGTLTFVAKGRRRMEFPVGSRWRPYLELFKKEKRWERVEDLVSPSSRPDCRRKTAAKVVERALEQCRAAAGIREHLHPHLLRHTYATYYYDRCRDPNKLRQHMGWAKIETAMLYVAAHDAKELDEIAESMFD